MIRINLRHTGRLSLANVPPGGTTDQVLTKNSGTDYDTSWQNSTGGGSGGSWGSITGTLSSQTDLQSGLDGKQTLDADLTTIATLLPSNDDILQRKSGAWTNRTPAQIKPDLSLVKSDVGLGSVDNTADLSKPVSTATQTALDLKETISNKSTLVSLGSSDTLYPTQNAVKTYVDTTVSGIGGYSDEQAQDAVGSILVDSPEIDFTYNDAAPSIGASLVSASIDESKLDASVNLSLTHANSALQNIVEDTTPQLGGNLDLNGNIIGAASAADLTKLSQVTSTAIELNYTDGVTSAIQAQLDAKQALDSDLTSIANLSPGNDDIIQRKSGAWANRTTAQLKSDLNLNNVDNTSDATKNSAAVTLTNKRIPKRIATLIDAATVTPNIDDYDGGKLTSLSQDSTIANPTGTPNDFQQYMLRVTSSSSRALTWGTQYRGSSTTSLPSATTGGGKTDYMAFQWNADASKYDLLALNQDF